ncbi:MAG: MotA/TolQ/ExbB proton channel family protein, partial [Smithellaceae bacterium]|nr:MotA/TolQ/ExbB proton channel family protein [Smithellaceae bacterium]
MVAGTAGAGNFHGSILGMILDAGPMVQFVLILLLIFSIVSWAIIFMKYVQVKKVRRENDSFIEAYMRTARISDMLPEAKKYRYSSIAEVFRAGYGELVKIAKIGKESTQKDSPDSAALPYELRNIDQLERAMNRASDAETSKLESTLGFLATTGSACPFIGLFGTVWGIMNTFQSIGARGSATLAVVAPGISEALIATAAGLAAAIPAVIFYNYYLNSIKNISLEMD